MEGGPDDVVEGQKSRHLTIGQRNKDEKKENS